MHFIARQYLCLLQEEAVPAEAEKAPAAVATMGASTNPEAASPAPAAPSPPPPPPAPEGPKPRADGRVIATPYAKQVAKKLKVDLKTIGGTGPNGRITASDVERAAGVGGGGGAATAPPPAPSSNGATPASAAPAAAAPVPAPSAAPAAVAAAAAAGTTVSELRGTTVPFSGMEKSVAKNMQDSLKVAEFRATVCSLRILHRCSCSEYGQMSVSVGYLQVCTCANLCCISVTSCT